MYGFATEGLPEDAREMSAKTAIGAQRKVYSTSSPSYRYNYLKTGRSAFFNFCNLVVPYHWDLCKKINLPRFHEELFYVTLKD